MLSHNGYGPGPGAQKGRISRRCGSALFGPWARARAHSHYGRAYAHQGQSIRNIQQVTLLVTCHICNTFLRYNRIVKQMMKSPIHKLVLNDIAVLDPTQYIKFDKYEVKNPTSKLVGNAQHTQGMPTLITCQQNDVAGHDDTFARTGQEVQELVAQEGDKSYSAQEGTIARAIQ